MLSIVSGASRPNVMSGSINLSPGYILVDGDLGGNVDLILDDGPAYGVGAATYGTIEIYYEEV